VSDTVPPLVDVRPVSDSVQRQLDMLRSVPSGQRGRASGTVTGTGATGEFAMRVGTHGEVGGFGRLSWDRSVREFGVRGSLVW
jgi:hypothetical protein